jgi:esterase/lipase
MIAPPVSSPAAGYDDAVARARAIMARDDDTVLPAAHTALLDHGSQTDLAVVLLHGITNNPNQYVRFGPMLHERGVNVFIPRMPYHGLKDRMTTGIAHLKAEEVLDAAGEALDIAAGLGKRVGVLGISMGGSLSAYFAQTRAIDVAVPVAPDFALLQFPYGLSRALEHVLLFLPNIFFWWDPRIRERQRPITAYPRCSTHALMQTMRIGDAVYAKAMNEPPKAGRIVTVVNPIDPAVNNEVTEAISDAWAGWRPNAVKYVQLRHLPDNHDIIDPDKPNARTDLVYPKLLESLIGPAPDVG